MRLSRCLSHSFRWRENAEENEEKTVQSHRYVGYFSLYGSVWRVRRQLFFYFLHLNQRSCRAFDLLNRVFQVEKIPRKEGG